MNIQKEIIRITSEYFEDIINFQKLSMATNEYKHLLEELCGQNLDIEKGKKDIEFENGKALGTFWAAMCIDDIIRTRRFVRGINKAIQEQIIRKKPIHILYAGTGPFAALILPIIFKYSKQEIKYTFLEINPLSIEILENVISKLGLKDHNIKLLMEDATKYKIDINNKPNIIVSETMQNALAKEQQVSIFLNLMKQVKYDSIFIPEKIELFIGLKKAGIPVTETQIKHYKKINKVFEVSKESMLNSNKIENESSKEILFTKKQTIIKEKELKDFNQIVLITEIQVFKNEKVVINESGLTTPIIIKDIANNLKNSVTINSQYKISSHPGLEYEICFTNNEPT